MELHKTGCTHIGKLLASLFDGVQCGKHNSAPVELIDSGRKFLGSVRNPWEWYLSLWAYGCDKKGLVYHFTTQPLSQDELALAPHSTRKPEEWKRCYSDVRSVSAFRDWLYLMNAEECWSDFGEGYGESPMASFSGLFTYRYISLFCRPAKMVITSLSNLKAYENEHCFINYFIRTEHLEDDFITAVKSCGRHLNKSKKRSIQSASITNASARRKNTAKYYDDGTRALIRERDALIIDKFSYTAPGRIK